jgi:hypothetical protein
MPLMVGLWLFLEKKRTWVILAILASFIIMFTSASSGPLLTFCFGILAFMFWPIRKSMRKVRWAIVAFLAALQLTMKAPIWFLLARVDVVQGSTGYHRAVLIDRAFANLSDWWLFGTKSTEAWADKNDHLFDVTNAYILAGANGGLLTMILFIAVIVIAYKAVGRTIRLGEIDRPGTPSLKLVWALGATLFVHTASYISVSYFDQNFVTWFMLIAFISLLCGDSLRMPRHEFLMKVNGETENSHPPIPALGDDDTENALEPANAIPVQTSAPAPEPVFSTSALREASNSRPNRVQDSLPNRAIPGTATK